MKKTALQAKWDEILRREGLGMSRGRRVLKVARTLREDDVATCSNCQGYHTLEGDCSAQE